MVKFSLLAGHLFFGVAGNIFALVSLHFLLTGKSIQMARSAFSEFLCSFATLIFGGAFYVIYYQADKHLITAGKFPMAHNVFMEVKEHSFIMFFLFSLFLQLRIFFTGDLQTNEFRNETKWVLGMIIFLGLLMSVTGFLVNAGFRVNQ